MSGVGLSSPFTPTLQPCIFSPKIRFLRTENIVQRISAYAYMQKTGTDTWYFMVHWYLIGPWYLMGPCPYQAPLAETHMHTHINTATGR